MWTRLFSFTNVGSKAALALVAIVIAGAIFEIISFFFFFLFLTELSGPSNEVTSNNTFLDDVLSFLKEISFWEFSHQQMLIVCILLSLCLREYFNYLKLILNRKWMLEVEFNLRKQLIETMLNAELLCTSKVGAGVLTDLAGQKARDAGKLFQVISQISSLFFTVTSYLAILLYSTPEIGIAAIVVGVLFIFVLNKSVITKRRYAQKIVKYTEDMSQNIERSYALRKTIKLDGLVGQELLRLDDQFKNISGAALTAEKVGVLLSSSMMIFIITGSLIATHVAFKNSYVDLAYLSAGLVMVIRTVPLMLGFQRLRNVVASYGPSFEAIETRIVEFSNNREKNGTKRLNSNDNPIISISNLKFSYSDMGEKKALKDINLKLSGGQTIALVGSSGVGKTTLINLITGLYKAKSGAICINGLVFSELDLKQYRSMVSYQPQDVMLFDGSFLDNLKIRNPTAEENAIQRLLNITNLSEIVSSLPNGLDTIIGERGHKLSGGQVQRLSICSNILKNSSILIFDEPTSSLDPKNERILTDLFNELAHMQGKLVLIVSHSWEVVKYLDRMIKMKNGKVVYDGSPKKELIQNV